jgi:hypothetical protein
VPKFKATFRVKDANGASWGFIEEVIEARDKFIAQELINRKYGGVEFNGFPIRVTDQPPASANVSTDSRNVPTNSSATSQPQPNGCLVAIGLVAVLIGSAMGLFKQSDQPDAYQQSPSTSTENTTTAETPQEQVPSPPAEQTSTESAQAEPLWGAFAVSPSTSTSAYATGYATEDEAKQAAVNSCAQSDCQPFASFRQGYAALAESDRNWYSTSGYSSEAEATNEAMRLCQEKDSDANCRITKTVNF